LAQPTGVQRASLPVDFATIDLAPHSAEFARLYPGISFDFDLTWRVVDLASEAFDVAIQMGKQPDSNLIARQLANLPCHASGRRNAASWLLRWTLIHDCYLKSSYQHIPDKG